MRRLFCYLEIQEEDKIMSYGRQWKAIFISYLTHLLKNTYHITIEFIGKDTVEQFKTIPTNYYFIYLKVLSRGNSHITLPDNFDSFATHSEFIGLIKEPLDFPIQNSTPFRFFDFCIIDPETDLPVKEEELFEKRFMNHFLSKLYDLSFEINHLFFPSQQKTGGFVYLAETSYELSAVRFSIKKELIKRGFQVLPEKAFKTNEPDLIEQIRTDLKNSVLSVHFFGSSFPPKHPQTNLPMEIMQNSIAASFYNEQSLLFVNGENTTYNFRRIIWFPENAKIRNEKYSKFISLLKHDQKLYAGADLIRSTPEELKDIIIQKLSGHTSKADAPPSNEFSIKIIAPPEIFENSRANTFSAIPQHTNEQYNKNQSGKFLLS